MSFVNLCAMRSDLVIGHRVRDQIGVGQSFRARTRAPSRFLTLNLKREKGSRRLDAPGTPFTALSLLIHCEDNFKGASDQCATIGVAFPNNSSPRTPMTWIGVLLVTRTPLTPAGTKPKSSPSSLTI